MLRVLHVVTYMGRGGLETMIMNYYRNIDRNKVQFDFLVHRNFRADYDNEIESLGGKIYRLPVLNPLNKYYRVSLNQFFDNHPEYTIIHVHQDCMSSVILKVAQKHGIPVRIAHSHSSGQSKNWRYIVKLYYRGLIPQYATSLIACSKTAGDWMFCGANYQILSNAINAKEYSFNKSTRETVRKRLGIKADDILVGHVGNFSAPKNHRFLIDIFCEIDKKVDGKLLMVGGKNLKPDSIAIMDDMIQKVKDVGIEDKVIFAGTRNDVHELMQAMDVFVFPSTFEGLPVTIIEAQAAGLPCLVSENVPMECKVTDLVEQMELSRGASVWAQKTIEMSKKTRKNTFVQIRNAGFDIKEKAFRLQEYYISLALGEKEPCLS